MLRLLIMVLLIAPGYSVAQKAALTPGKPFPYSGKFLVNNRIPQYKTLDSYKGKYLLLDLFSSNCIQCFQNLSKLDSFNRKYEKKLTILLIGLKDNKLEALYEKFRKRYNLQLDVSIDSVLIRKVKVFFLPTYVWIGPDGLIRAVSAPDKVTAANIDRFINGQSLPFDVVSETQPFDPKKDYLSEGNGGADSNYLIRSVLGKWNPTLPYITPEKLQFLPESRKFITLAKTMEGLYRYAYFNKHFWLYGDSLNGKTWLYPILPDGEISQEDDKFCFAASYKTEHAPNLGMLLKTTLEQYFGYTGSIVQKQMPYYSVSVMPAFKEQLRTKGGKLIAKHSHASLDYRNVTLDKVIERISYYSTAKIPFLNESEINYNVDVTIEAILTDENDFFGALQKIGIVIERKYRLMDVLVLSKIEKGVAGP